MGQVLQAGAGQAPARQAALAAGLPTSVPATTVNRVCGSGLKAIMLAAAAIRAGDADLVVAGGMESMNLAPYYLPNARFGYRLGDGTLKDGAVSDGLWCAIEGCHMGTHAERVALQSQVSREDQDAFALDSHRRAVAAQDAGRFDDEMAPVTVRDAKGRETVVTADEGPRRDTSLEALARLKPVFPEPAPDPRDPTMPAATGGTVTAGNAPGITDGAAATVIASATDRGNGSACGHSPGSSATRRARSIPAGCSWRRCTGVQNLLAKTGLAMTDFDLVELNEAFAAQALADGRALGFDWSKVNVNGGGDRAGPPHRGERRADRRDAAPRASPAAGSLRPGHPVSGRGRLGGDGVRARVTAGRSGPDPAETPRGAGARGRQGGGTMTQAAAPITGRLYIAGEWLDSVSGRTFESRNPADRDDLVGTFQAGSAADVAMAVRAADAAKVDWRATPAPRRGELLLEFARLLRRDKERLARHLTREMGKVLPEARGDVQEAIDIAELMAGEGRRMFGDTVPSELPDKWAMSIRQPIGIAGLITPWNFPMAIPAWKAMPALVAGNTIVFKPASDTPGCATLLVELMDEAGFPPGVVNLVTGTGAEVGDAIVESPDIPVLSFTGSTATGKRIAERAGRRLKRLALELGGKNAVVVMADADLDLAVDGIAWSAFGTTGQRCTACSRVIVEAPVAERLLAKLEARVRALRLGDGLDPTTDVGPLINEASRSKVEEYIELGRREGELVCGGRAARAGALDAGCFFEPTIFAGVRPMARIAQEEIFGPVLSVITVPDYEAAMTAANGIRYGLSASVFTSNVNTAFRAMRDFAAGLVYVNAGTIGAETHLPFGGWKETGNGHREAGHAALDSFTEWKSIYVDFSGKLQRAQIDNQPG